MEKTKVYISVAITLIVVFGAFWLVGLGFRAPASSGIPLSTATNTEVEASDAVGLGIDAAQGEYLLDTFGLTLYTTTKGECTGECFVIWPPYIADGEISEGNLGTVYLTDLVAYQYTWKGEPLYYYVNDSFIGEFGGDGLGGVWNVAKP